MNTDTVKEHSPGKTQPEFDRRELRKLNRSYAIDQLTHNPVRVLKVQTKVWRWALIGGMLRRFNPDPPDRFMVICQARSGSNFLLTLLNYHPRIRHLWEPFGEHFLRQPDTRQQIEHIGTLPYLEKKLERIGDEQVVGFKILYHHHGENYSDRWNIPSMEPVRSYLKEQADIKVIHLKRRNTLRSLVSVQVAERNLSYIIFNATR